MSTGSASIARQAARYEEYTRLRDQGVEPWEAGTEIGVSNDTADRYETAYRKAHPETAPQGRPFRLNLKLDRAQGRKGACRRWHGPDCGCWETAAAEPVPAPGGGGGHGRP